MHDQLKVQLLGGFSIQLNGQPLHAFRSAKTRGLLAYLAAQPDQEHSRDSLAALLWGDSTDQAAKTNLRIELSNLKKILADHPALEISRVAVRFHSALATLDVHRFQEAVGGFMALSAETQNQQLAQLIAALDLYQGEFLAGFHLGDAIEYEDWQLITRERLHEQMMQALERLQLRYAEQGYWMELATVARRQLALLPWQESAHRYLMQALAAQGEIQLALAQYARCCQILHEELGVEPSLATQDLAAHLRSGKPAAPPIRHNLPQQAKSFVGRSEERERLRRLLMAETLVTIVGIGGMGKSHLALTVAQDMLHNFRDGVWFVSLANIPANESNYEQIILTIAAAIGYPMTDTQRPLDELLQHLADKSMLLILDNWDHLTDSAEFVLSPLLSGTPVHVLATSRARLKLPGEITLALDGLTLDEAFTLFVERARRLVPSFATVEASHDSASILRICEQVAGLPLGIELAASWVEHYAVVEISRTIAEIEIEPQQAEGVVERHQSLGAVFEYSWRLLSPTQQQILARLSVFQGSFDRNAAAAIAESTLQDLSALIGHSLVQRIAAGRYNLHPLIREFAAHKLVPDQESSLHSKHSHHYLQALAATPPAQWASQQLIDFENIRSAWQRAVSVADAALLEASAISFSEFIYQFGLMVDGATLLQAAIEQFDGQAQHNELVAQLLERQWMFTKASKSVTQSDDLLQRVLTLTTQPKLLINAHIRLANGYSEVGAWEQMNYHFEQVEALALASADPRLYISTVESRIHINAIHFRGDFAQGIARLQEMLTLLDTLDDQSAADVDLRTQLLVSLALVAVRYGDYALAIRCARQNLAQTIEGQQQNIIWFLLDLALAEQFAGLYAEAIAHNQEALTLAEKIGVLDDAGLFKANLCLTLRQAGDLEQALTYGLAGIETLQQLGLTRQEGQARNRVGHTLLAMQRWDDAYEAYHKALAVWETIEHPNRYEALAGRAVAAQALGKAEEALALVEETLAFVGEQGLTGIVEPIPLLLNCAGVISQLGERERVCQILQQAETWKEEIASRISDDAVRAVFLARPDVARLAGLHQA